MNDSETIETIRRFLASEKSTGITPVDILLVVHLMLQKAEDHDVFTSQQTLARKFCCDWRTINRSQKRLVDAGWISSSQRRATTNAVSLNYEAIPAEEILRLQITPEARQLAGVYQNVLRQSGRKKFPKQWLRQQFASAQRIINACEGDLNKAGRLIAHALTHTKHQKKARQSLYNLFGRWKKIQETYAHLEEQAAEMKLKEIA